MTNGGVLCPKCGDRTGATVVTIHPSRINRDTGKRQEFPELCCTECDYRERQPDVSHR